MKKKILPIFLIIFIMSILLVGVTYAAVYVAKMPISLPFLEAQAIYTPPEQGIRIAKQWEDVKIYKLKERVETVEEIIEQVEVEVRPEDEVFAQLELVDIESLKKYIEVYPEVIDNGYEKLFIDKVDLDNTPTGIKSIYGDDVLAIDVLNGITIVGRNIEYGDGKVAKAKLAIVDDSSQLGMSVVDDLSYWDPIETHVKREGAILGVNCNGYTWHDNGKWASMYGAFKLEENIIRKADKAEAVIAFTEDGDMSIGTDINEAYNATEYAPALIKDGELVYSAIDDPEANIRMAQTAIGQDKDGKILILVVAGGIYGSDNGAVYQECLDIMDEYNAENASMLSGGSRTVMFWNNRIVTHHDGYKDTGVKLPTAIVVNPAPLKMIDETTEDAAVTEDAEAVDTTEVDSVIDINELLAEPTE